MYDIENVDQFIDFVDELRQKNCFHIIEQIFQYLNTRELCNISLVSKTWMEVLSQTLRAKERRDKYLKTIRKIRKSVGQENWPIKKRTSVPTPVPTPVTESQRRKALSDIRNVYRTRKPKNIRSNNSRTQNIRQRDMNLRGMR